MLRDYRASDDLWPTEHLPKRSRRPGRSSPTTSSTRSATCDGRAERRLRRRRARRRGWTTRGLPGKGEPLEHRFVSGGIQNEIYEIRRGDLHAALRIPPPTAPEAADDGILREWRIIDALDGTDVPHTPAIAACADTAVLGRTFYLMGFVDGWSPMGLRRADGSRGRSRSTPTSRPARGWPTSSSRASPCCRRSTGRPRACRTSAGPTASTSARSTAGPRSSSGSRAASCPASTRPPPGCAPTSRSTTSPGSCTATTSSPTSCTTTARRPGWRPSSTGRWARSATRSSTSRWVVQSLARGHQRRPRQPVGGYVDMAGMPSRTEVLDHYATVSGRQVDDIDYYLVLAKWKLAVVLEQGFQRAGDDEKLLAFGPIVLELMQGAAELAETHRLPRADASTCAPRSARRTARRRSSRVEERPAARARPGPGAGAGRRRGRELPRRADRRGRVPDQGAAAVRAGQRVRRRGDRGRRRRARRVAVGDRVFGSGARRRVRRGGRRAGDRVCADPRRRRRRTSPPPSASPTARRTTCCDRSPGCSRARSWSSSVPAAASAWPPCSSARCWAPRSPRWRRRPRSSTCRRAAAPRTSSTIAAATCGQALREQPARRRRRRRRPRRRRPGRAGAAVAALGRPLRHRRLRLGRDPPHPAEPRAAQGHRGPRLRSSATSPRTRPTRLQRNEAELLELLAAGRAAPAHRRPLRLDEAAPRPLRYVADGKAIGKVVLDVQRTVRRRRRVARRSRSATATCTAGSPAPRPGSRSTCRPPEQYEGRFFQHITPVPDSEHLAQAATGEQDKIGFSIASGAYFVETNGGGPIRPTGLRRRPDHRRLPRQRRGRAALPRRSPREMYGEHRPVRLRSTAAAAAATARSAAPRTPRGVWDGVRALRHRLADGDPEHVHRPHARPAGAAPTGSTRSSTRSSPAAAATCTRASTTRSGTRYRGDADGLPAAVVVRPPHDGDARLPRALRRRAHGRSRRTSTTSGPSPATSATRRPRRSHRDVVQHPCEVVADDHRRRGRTRSGSASDASRARPAAASTPLARVGAAPPRCPSPSGCRARPTIGLLGADLVVHVGCGRRRAARSCVDVIGDIAVLGPAEPDVRGAGSQPGDAVEVDNRGFLAAQTYHRHQVPTPDFAVWDQFRARRRHAALPAAPAAARPAVRRGRGRARCRPGGSTGR